jgi:hypothetical protein
VSDEGFGKTQATSEKGGAEDAKGETGRKEGEAKVEKGLRLDRARQVAAAGSPLRIGQPSLAKRLGG